jgi:hypothetical protein
VSWHLFPIEKRNSFNEKEDRIQNSSFQKTYKEQKVVGPKTQGPYSQHFIFFATYE